jgi:hypothetical protein
MASSTEDSSEDRVSTEIHDTFDNDDNVMMEHVVETTTNSSNDNSARANPIAPSRIEQGQKQQAGSFDVDSNMAKRLNDHHHHHQYGHHHLSRSYSWKAVGEGTQRERASSARAIIDKDDTYATTSVDIVSMMSGGDSHVTMNATTANDDDDNHHHHHHHHPTMSIESQRPMSPMHDDNHHHDYRHNVLEPKSSWGMLKRKPSASPMSTASHGGRSSGHPRPHGPSYIITHWTICLYLYLCIYICVCVCCT